jgi:hypothetical protein
MIQLEAHLGAVQREVRRLLHHLRQIYLVVAPWLTSSSTLRVGFRMVFTSSMEDRQDCRAPYTMPLWLLRLLMVTTVLLNSILLPSSKMRFFGGILHV